MQKIKQTVPAFFNKFEKALKKNEIFEDAYKGYNIFFSPIKKAKIWIIGINSGTGNPKTIRSIEPLDFNEYYASGEYNVSKQFRKLFIDYLDKEEDLKKNTIVTNLHFIRTTRTKTDENGYGLIDLIRKKNLGKELYEEYWSNLREWNLELLNSIEPDLILCFGTEPYKNFFNFHSEFECIEKETIDSHILCDLTFKKNKIKLIKINRSQSTISKIESLANLIIKSKAI